MGLKLFVDDTREFPKGFECARSYEECLLLFRLFGRSGFEFVTLDYSLGGAHTGLDILAYMSEHGIAPEHINIHSNHIEGMQLMRRYAEEHFPDARVTMNTLDK